MSRINVITSLYPAAKFTLALTVHEANSRMYLFLGERQYSSFYKVVKEEDVQRLKNAVEKCKKLLPDEEISECIRLLDQQGEYGKYIVTLKNCDEEEYVYLEMQRLGGDERELKELKDRLELFETYLTINGKALFIYSPQDDMFHLFWMDYSQVMDVCKMPLKEWRRQVAEKKLVAVKDMGAFENFCDTLAQGSSEQTFTFSGRILSFGDTQDGYKIQMIPREHQGRKIVLGVWALVNEKTGGDADDYLEGTFVDSLTKILNKKSITEYAQRTVKPGSQVAVVIVDVDYFKNFNDTYGHLFGDQVIVAVADAIRNAVGENGMVGRIGGDEFLVILKDYSDEAGLRSYLRSIKFNVSMLFLDRMGEKRLTCSIGASQCGVDSNDYNELFRIADKALYIAKQKGRNRFIIYDVKKHGKFHMADAGFDLTEIRDGFYSESDMSRMNKLLAKMVLNGRDCLPEILELLVHIVMSDRIVIFWGEQRDVIAQYPMDYMWDQDELYTFEAADYLSQFEDDVLVKTNTNSMEYTFPAVFRILKKHGVQSYIQILLRNGAGEPYGMVSLESCSNRNDFSKLAVQLVENMCRILNAVLIREITEK